MKDTSSSASWFARPKPNAHAKLRLFCFPFAGGGALIYRTWPFTLPPEIEVFAAQLPGRSNRLKETPYTDLTALTDAVAENILPYLDRPFAFFGHSMGAMISFELARNLRRRGSPQPVHLLVSGRRAPQLGDSQRPMHDLPEPEFIEELGSLDGTPPEVLAHPELMRLMIPLLRADFSVVETYRYEPDAPLDCRITALGGLQDAHVTRPQLEAWQEQTTASCNVRMLPGNHFFLQTEQPLLLRLVTRELQSHIL
ncbi:MAG TPA: alpha/beta fold hydrolase [Pyrinomonadaceae bacterium]|nr:alpha/beta fold hydrolase [Pyrinomonadaceae bacterium]